MPNNQNSKATQSRRIKSDQTRLKNIPMATFETKERENT